MTRSTIPLSALTPDPANARKHGRKNLETIKASLVRFGQRKPLVCQRREDGAVIVRAGNGMLEAMRELEWEEAWVEVFDEEDDEAKAFALVDNRAAELSVWDELGLAQNLADIIGDGSIEEGLDGLGFSAADLQRILGDPDVREDGVAVVPEETRTKPGDLWQLGPHRLICGDATDPNSYVRLFKGDRKLAGLVATDPPYAVEYRGDNRPDSKGKDWTPVYNEVAIEDLETLLDATLGLALARAKKTAAIYIWHAHLQYPTIDRVLEKHDVLRHQPIIWKKSSPVLTHCVYQWNHEACIFGWRRGNQPPHHLPSSPEWRTVWEVDWEGGKKRIIGNLHPTQKPIRLFEIPIRQHTVVGEIVLEPFSGSGSQLIAAAQLDRVFRGIELEPFFVDLALGRWETLTGETAELVDP